MGKFVLAIDQGTTGTTVLVIDESITVRGRCTVDFPNHYPQPGWVEHDLEEIWTSIGGAVRGALDAAGVGGGDIAAIGITNQRETTALWNAETGEALHRAIVWQDRRTADFCQVLREAGHADRVKQVTGLVLDPYFSGTKLRWLLENVDGARRAASAGEALFGTIDSWLGWRLTGEHVTDPSNASRTLLMSLETCDWDQGMCDMLDVPAACLPKIVPSSGTIGHTSGVGFLPDGIPVAGLIGDQQGALFGQACFAPGMAKSTYGTGAFVLLNTGSQPVQSHSGMLTTVAWQLGDRVEYALEGSAFIAGAAVQWLRDGLQIIDSAPEIEALARSVDSSDGVLFVPALTGLGAPHWRPDARGLLTGVTQATGRAHIARAVLDGIALQVADILEAMATDLGGPLKELRVDGGASANNLLMQRQADLLSATVVRPDVLETTGLGSGLLAGLAVGIWSSVDQISEVWNEQARFSPAGDREELDAIRTAWATAVAKA